MEPRQSPVCVWDFTLSADFSNHLDLKNILDLHCKKWSFQLEKGEEDDYLHYQGRVSLKEKLRLTGVRKILDKAHWSVTSAENSGNMFYVNKETTRVEGPWSNLDKPLYIPRDVREMKELYPWQRTIVEDIVKVYEPRHVDCIINEEGNIGKTALTRWIECYGLGESIPFCNDFKDILQMAHCMPEQKCYLIDMPRAINKERLQQMYSAIEILKGGTCFDMRYKFQKRRFDPPRVIVFTNECPDMGLLSWDRWKLWTVKNRELVKWTSPNQVESIF